MSTIKKLLNKLRQLLGIERENIRDKMMVILNKGNFKRRLT